jgi:4-carboxymuconolactone decarboxylase
MADNEKEVMKIKISPERIALRKAVLEGGRGGLGGPHDVIGISRELNHRVLEVGKYLNLDSRLDKRLRELAIITVARAKNARVPWSHVPAAIDAGVSLEVINAIAEHKDPSLKREDEQLVYKFTKELLESDRVSDATYHAVTNILSPEQLVDLTVIVGYYNMICWITLTYDINLVEKIEPPLPD